MVCLEMLGYWLELEMDTFKFSFPSFSSFCSATLNVLATKFLSPVLVVLMIAVVLVQNFIWCGHQPDLCPQRSSSFSSCRSWSSPGCQTGSWAGGSAARRGRVAGGAAVPAAGCRCCWSEHSWRSAGTCCLHNAAMSWENRRKEHIRATVGKTCMHQSLFL